ncbi:MAG TPA: alpha/beta hydrolase [Mycobacteriales bacterium]
MSEAGSATTYTLSDGQQIACATTGSGPDIVCVPGGPARAAGYLGDLGGLDGRYTLRLVDNRGSGGSRPTDLAALTVERIAQDLVELIPLLGLERPALLAHSFGARVVGKALELRPDLAGSVVLVTPAPIVVDPALFTDARRDLVEQRAGDPAYADAVEAARALPSARPREQGFLLEETTPLWYGRWEPQQQEHAAREGRDVDVRAAMTLRNEATRWSPPDVSEVDAPVLVVAGSLDFLTPPAAAHAVHDLFTRGTYVEIDGAGHFPWVDEPAAFAAVVDDFLRGDALT